MIVKGELTYKYAIILDADKMRALNDVIVELCSNIRYTAELKNGREEVYEDLEGLLSSENFGNERILKLNISGWKRGSINDIHMYIGPQISIYSKSVSVKYSYELEDKQLANDFEREINRILEKSKAPYWLFVKVDSNYVPLFICIIMFIIGRISGLNTKEINISASSLVLLMILVILILAVIKLLGRLFSSTILPVTAFVWGEEIQRTERMSKLRNQLLWGGIIAFFISIIGGVVATLITL